MPVPTPPPSEQATVTTVTERSDGSSPRSVVFKSQGELITVTTMTSDSPLLPLAVTSETETEFFRLVGEWRNKTRHLSLFNDKFDDLAYVQLIGMGKEILPLVFRELDTTTSDWFWLLAALAREDAPIIPSEDNGRVRKIADIWMEWGRKHGYV